MTQRPSLTLDAALVGLLGMIEKFTRRLMPAAPEGRPVGGPVVFRHYL
jgi:hypothetical protein